VNLLWRLALQEKKNYDSSRLDVVEIALVPDMLSSLFSLPDRAKDLSTAGYQALDFKFNGTELFPAI